MFQKQDFRDNRRQDSVILIGMPGAGKSTIGVLLAKMMAKDFIDTDVLIQLKHKKTLNDILHEQGYLALRQIEEMVLLESNFSNHVIATGGSAVYSNQGMMHLATFGPIVYLSVEQQELQRRIHNMDTRGIARAPSQSFEDVFNERRALYEHWADVTIQSRDKSQEQLVDEILIWLTDSFSTQDA